MKRVFLASLFMFLAVGAANAQDRFSKLAWEIGFPLGDTKDLLVNEDISVGGISFDFRKKIQDNLTVGGNMGWMFFNGSTTELLQSGTTTVDALRQFYLNYLPIMANTHYYFDLGKQKDFYVGTGLGGVWTLQRTDIGSFFTDNDNFHFGVMPEIGFNFPISFSSMINVSAKYNMAFATGGSIDYSYFAVNVGWSSWW